MKLLFVAELRRRAVPSATHRQPAMEIPQLATDRLLLRVFRVEDVEAYAQMMADLRVTQYLGEGRPLSRVEAWRQMA